MFSIHSIALMFVSLFGCSYCVEYAFYSAAVVAGGIFLMLLGDAIVSALKARSA